MSTLLILNIHIRAGVTLVSIGCPKTIYWRKQPMQDYFKDASNGRESSKVVMSKSKSKKTVL